MKNSHDIKCDHFDLKFPTNHFQIGDLNSPIQPTGLKKCSLISVNFMYGMFTYLLTMITARLAFTSCGLMQCVISSAA